jgi:hypothetical protein
MTADYDVIPAILQRHPELSVLAEGVRFSLGSNFDAPFRVPSAARVDLSPAVLRSGAALPVHVRHALEVAMWHGAAPAPRTAALETACAGLACWTALQYVSSLPGPQAALEALPAWMRQLHRFTQERDLEHDATAIATELATIGGCLLHLQRPAGPGGVGNDRGAGADAAALIAELLDLARPAERLLTTGGDSRICLDPVSRANKYGCSAVPATGSLAFSACTASTPSITSYRAAERGRRRLIEAAAAGVPLRAAYAAAIEDVRRAVSDGIGLGPLGADVVLAASGTDCELHALHLATAGHDDPVLSIVVGPDEIGGGSLHAASGRHFDRQTPAGTPAEPGQPVNGFPVHRIRVQTVSLRDARGRPVPMPELDAAVTALAHRAVAAGARVLLHVVDGSKTGLCAPGLPAVARLQQELGDRMAVLVDAAQMRTPVERLAAFVRSGWMVMVSGSKFFMGPPFSGALLVPTAIAARAAADHAVPAGLADYLSAFEAPPGWTGWRAALPSRVNLGLLLRWRAALAEVAEFQSAGRLQPHLRFAALAARVSAELRRRPALAVVPGPEPDAEACDSIWTFALRRTPERGGEGVFDYEEAWQAYGLLNRDLSSCLPVQATAAERRAAATRCHLGQPVRLRWADGREAGALRIALGARSLHAAEDDVVRVFDKLDVVQRYWTELTARQAVA